MRVFSMTSPGTKGAASCLAALGINPITPTKPPLTPAELAERKERSDQRKRIRAAAPGAEAADQELAATEMTLAVPEAAAQLKANAKKARVDRTAATADAVARSRLEEATPPPAAATSLQPKGGEATAQSVPKRIKKKKELSKAMPDDTYAESRADSVADSETSTREPKKKVGNPAHTTANHTTHTLSQQTTSNHSHMHTAQTTHNHTLRRVPIWFSERSNHHGMYSLNPRVKTKVDWVLSPLVKQSPTPWRVGEHPTDHTSLVCSQNITIKIMIADADKRGLGFLFR